MGSTASVQRQEFARYVADAMRLFGPVQAKAMFGGHGLYRDGLMFAILQGGQLYLKVDAESEGAFVERGLAPFVYEARGKTHSLGYRLAPPEVFDEPVEMMRWAGLGYECAVRQAASGARGKSGGQSRIKAPGKPDGERVSSAEQGRSGGQARPGGRQQRAKAGVHASDAAHWAQAAPLDRSLAGLPNLGDKSQQMLQRAGIATPADLTRLGAVVAYARVKAACPGTSLNLLWALEGALSGRPWQQVAATDRASLLMALEDVQKAQPLASPPGKAAKAGESGRKGSRRQEGRSGGH